MLVYFIIWSTSVDDYSIMLHLCIWSTLFKIAVFSVLFIYIAVQILIYNSVSANRNLQKSIFLRLPFAKRQKLDIFWIIWSPSVSVLHISAHISHIFCGSYSTSSGFSSICICIVCHLYRFNVHVLYRLYFVLLSIWKNVWSRDHIAKAGLHLYYLYLSYLKLSCFHLYFLYLPFFICFISFCNVCICLTCTSLICTFIIFICFTCISYLHKYHLYLSYMHLLSASEFICICHLYYTNLYYLHLSYLYLLSASISSASILSTSV